MRRLDRFAWWWHRLRAMSPAEVRWRLEEQWTQRREAARAGREPWPRLDEPRGAALRDSLRRSLAPLVPAETWRDAMRAEFPAALARLEEQARAARDGRVAIYARVLDAGVPARWLADPASGLETPRIAAARLDYRDAAIAANARRIWELNRHHHLAEAALWAWVARDLETARWVVAQILDWCERNPPLVGINWTSALEAAIRTLAWTEIAALLVDLGDEAIGDDALERMVGAWARQIEHVRTHDSRFSSANNHRIGEAAAVAVGGLALPFHPRAAEWWTWAAATLDEELARQIAPDGVGREQAFAYQRFVIDFATVVRVLARGHGRDLAPATVERLGAACAFLHAVTRDDGLPFAVGDDDEGRAFALGEAYEERTRATLECAGWLHGRAEWRRARTPRARWLGLAPAEERVAHAQETPAPVLRVFPDGGYAVAKSGGAHLLFDAGPLGFGTLAAHGHADALSIALWLGGDDLLIDPATGSYHGDPEWREALRGTRAHNTLQIDGRDQSERRGLFLWGARAQTRLLAAGGHGEWVVVAGEHDGYAALGVPRTRRLAIAHLETDSVTLLVLDEAIGTGRHALRSPWHLGEGVPVAMGGADGPAWHARFPHGATLVARSALLPHHGDVSGEHFHGGDAADAHFAPRFEERRAQGVVALAGEVPLPAGVAWALRARATAPEPITPELTMVAGGLSVRADLGSGRTLRALVAAPEADAVEDRDARLEGRMAAWVEGDDALAAEAPAAVAGARGLHAGGHAWRAPGEPVTGVVMRAVAVAVDSNSEGSAG